MPNEYNNTLEYNHGERSFKVPFITYIDLECLLEKIRSCINNPKKSYTEKKAKHESLGWVTTVKCSFDATTNKYDYYKERDCIKKLCKKIKDRAMEIINYEEKEMIPLTDKENKSYEKQKVCQICKSLNYTKKSEIIAITLENLEELLKIPKEIPVVIHNGSTYDYHFIIKQLAEEFKDQFECLGENRQKYITFSVPIKKELHNGKAITHKLKFIDYYRFMQSKLSDLVDNLSGIYKEECKAYMERKKIK